MDATNPAPAQPAQPAAFDRRLLTFHCVGMMGLTTWHYAARRAFTFTPLRAALRPGFFDQAAADLHPGHIIIITALDGAAQLYVLANDGARLTTAPMCWTGTIPHPPAIISTEAPDARTD